MMKVEVIRFVLASPNYQEIIGRVDVTISPTVVRLLRDLATSALAVAFDIKVIVTQKSDKVLVTDSNHIINVWPEWGGGPILMKYGHAIRQWGFVRVEHDLTKFLHAHHWEHVPEKMRACISFQQPTDEVSQPV